NAATPAGGFPTLRISESMTTRKPDGSCFRDRACRSTIGHRGALLVSPAAFLARCLATRSAGGHRPGGDTSGRGAYTVRGKREAKLSNAGPPKAELRKQVEAAMASGVRVAKLFCPSERAVDVVAKSPPQHRTRVGKPRQGNKEKTRKRCLVLLSALSSHFCL